MALTCLCRRAPHSVLMSSPWALCCGVHYPRLTISSGCDPQKHWRARCPPRAWDVTHSAAQHGRRGAEADPRFSAGRWGSLATGASAFETSLVAFDCRLVEARLVATHYVVIGAVVEAAIALAGLTAIKLCGRVSRIAFFHSPPCKALV
jgi:hypothetical protein